MLLQDGKHMFQAVEHMFQVEKHKFHALKHIKLLREKSFVAQKKKNTQRFS